MEQKAGTSDSTEAEKDFRSRLKTAEIMFGPALASPQRDKEDAGLLGRNILHDELEYFEGSELAKYTLSQDVRDRLLTHARQDTASNYGLLVSVLLRLDRTERQGKRLQRWNIILSSVILVCVLILIVRL